MTLKRSVSGRRYSDRRERPLVPATPPDPRLALPEEQRVITRTTLHDGTVLTSYDDPPLPALLAENPDPLDELDAPQTWRADKPQPRKGGRVDRWEHLR